MKHGLFGTPIYACWSELRARCRHPGHAMYSYYGGRGIVVCNFINRSPESIISLIGNKPSELTIDRIDVNGNYSCGACDECRSRGWPLNIRWASRLEQQRNRRITVFANINGSMVPVSKIASDSGFVYNTILRRVRRGASGQSLLVATRNAPKELTGQRFGKLVVERFDRHDGTRAYWICRCDCGQSKSVRQNNLTSGNSTTCGKVECCGRGRYPRR